MTVAVVGAGVSGLALAHHLDERGVDAVVYEARDEPGGVVRSREVEGRVVDLGPQRTRLTPAVRDLVDAAGLTDRVREGADAPLYVYHDGALRRVPTDVRSAVTTDLLSLRGKLRALAEPLTDRPREGETVGAFLRRAFGREVAERVVGPLYAGLYGSDPDEMPVRHSFGKAIEKLGNPRSLLLAGLRHRLAGDDPPPVVTFPRGLGELPTALAERYADRIRFGAPVETVERVGEGRTTERSEPVADGGGRYRVVAGDERRVVDDVVFTTPAEVTADLARGVAPEAARALDELTYSPLAVVALVADGGLDAAGYQVGPDASLSTLGVTSTHCLFGREGLHTCYLGGRDAPALLDASDERLGTVAASEFESVTGLSARPLTVHRVRPGMPAYDRSWSAVDDLSLPAGLHVCANFLARAGIPGRVRHARRLAASLAT